MKTLFLHSPTMPNTANEAFLDTLLPQEVLEIVFDQVVNQSQAMHDISSILLTCKKWKHIFEKNPCISLLRTLFQFKENHPSPVTFPQEYIETKQSEHFTPQEFKLIDRVLLYQELTLEKLLMVDSQLFHPKSLFLSLLDRYIWDPEVCKRSANQNIRQVAEEQLSILNSLVSVNDEQRLTLIKNEFIKKLYYGSGRETEKWYQVRNSIISTLKKIPHFNDKEILMHIGRYFGRFVFDIHDGLSKDREIVWGIVQQDWRALQFADESLKKDREIVRAAIQANAWALQYADESLKKDREIVLAAIQQDGYALQYADESLKKDQEIVLTAVQQDGLALEYADESFKKDREIVLAAVRQNGEALEFADESFKKDREIVLIAVQQEGSALRFANASFKKDRDIVLAAVEENGSAFQYADESFRKDREFVMAAVQKNGLALEYADESLKQNQEIILAAVSKIT